MERELNRKLLLFVLFVFSNVTFGSLGNIEKELYKKNKSLKASRLKITKIRLKIDEIDNAINGANAKFSKVVDLKRIINREIQQSQDSTKRMRIDLELSLKEVKKLLAGLYLVDGLKDGEYRFLLIKKLKEKKIKMTEIEKSFN